MALLIRKHGRPPEPDWFRQRESFPFESHGAYYDHIVLHPPEQDALGSYRGHGVEFMRAAGAWRLRRVMNR